MLQLIGKTQQTLRNWDKSGRLKPAYITDGGHRMYSQEQLNAILGINPKNKITVGYCRVNSNKQKDDLERQINYVREYMIAKGYQFEIITDIGSGINYNKKGLNKLFMTLFSARLQGKRAHKAKKLISELKNND